MTYLEVTEFNLGLGGNDIGLVYPSEGDTVDLVGSSYKEETAVELLKENNTLSAEATSEEDEDGSRGNGSTQFSGPGDFTALLGYSDILSGVETRSLGSGDKTGSTVLFTTDFLLDVSGLFSCSGFC